MMQSLKAWFRGLFAPRAQAKGMYGEPTFTQVQELIAAAKGEEYVPPKGASLYAKPTFSQFQELIEAVKAGGGADESDLAAKLDSTSAAPAFSEDSTYEVGDPVTYNGVIYRCTTAVTSPGAWDGGHWEVTPIVQMLDTMTVVDDQLVPFDGPGSEDVSAFGNAYLSHFSNWSSIGSGSYAYTARNSPKQDWMYPSDLFTDRFVFVVKAPLTGGYGAFRRSLVFPFSGVYRVSIEYTPIKQGPQQLQLPVVIGLSCNGGKTVWNNVGQCEYGRLHSAHALVSAKAGTGFVDVMAKEIGDVDRNGFAFSRIRVELVDKAGVEVSEIADSLTADGDSPVKSSGIWSKILGSLAALPEGFTSLYGWCADQFSRKASRAADPTEGNLAALDASGNPTDSGKKPSDFATAVQGTKADDSVQRVLDNANPSAKTAVTVGVRSTEAAADRGQASLAVGDHPKASGKNAVATGTWTQATAQDAHAEGNLSQATNNGAHAEGNNTKATGAYSHAEGTDTEASKLVAHAEGNYTTAAGTGAHSEGMFAKASGVAAHAEGSNLDKLAAILEAAGADQQVVALFRSAATDAEGAFSHTEGLVSATSQMGSHAQGFRASDGGNQFSFVWQGYSGAVPTSEQMQALLNDPTSQDAQAALQCLVTALNARAAYTSKGPGTFCVNPAPQGGSSDPKSGLFVGDESLVDALKVPRIYNEARTDALDDKGLLYKPGQTGNYFVYNGNTYTFASGPTNNKYEYYTDSSHTDGLFYFISASDGGKVCRYHNGSISSAIYTIAKNLNPLNGDDLGPTTSGTGVTFYPKVQAAASVPYAKFAIESLPDATIAASTSYVVGSLVKDTTTNKAYRCKAMYTTGTSPTMPSADTAHWTEIPVLSQAFDLLDGIEAALHAINNGVQS